MAEVLPIGDNIEIIDGGIATLINPELPEFEELLERQPDSMKMVLGLAEICQQFARVYRGPRYIDNSSESDVEHSFMVSTIATELAQRFYPDLNIHLIDAYGRVHDLIEVKVGDVVTYNISEEDRLAKEAREHAALGELLAELPPYNRKLVADYEAQQDPESQFTRMVDKLMPLIVDIIGQGSRLVYEDPRYLARNVGDLQESHKKSSDSYKNRFGKWAVILTMYDDFARLFEAKFDEELPYLEGEYDTTEEESA